MIFAHLTSCFVTTVKPYQGSDDTVQIRWQPAAPGAQMFPYPHAYQPNLWTNSRWEQYEGIGEVNGAYHHWVHNAASTLPGTHFEGDPSWYLTGVPPDHRNDPTPVCAEGLFSSTISLGTTADNGIFSVLLSVASLGIFGSFRFPLVELGLSVSGRYPPGVLISFATLGLTASGRIPSNALASYVTLGLSVEGLMNSTATVYVTGASMPTGATTAIPFSTEEIDTDHYWSVGAPTVLTMPADGRYLFTIVAKLQPGGAAPAEFVLRIHPPSGIQPVGVFECFSLLDGTITLVWIADLLAGDNVNFPFSVPVGSTCFVDAFATVTLLRN